MAWALQFDGVNDLARLPSRLTLLNTDSYVIHIDVSLAMKNNAHYLYGKDSNENLNYVESTNRLQWAIGNNPTLTLYPTISMLENRVVIKLEKDADVFTMTVGSDSVQLTDSSTSHLKIDAIGNQTGGSPVKPLNGLLHSFKIDCTTDTSKNRNWSATASNHGTGTPILIDTIGGNNATGVNMPTDGSAWIDLGGGGITITEETVNTNYTSLNPVVNLTGSISIVENAVNTNYTSLDPILDLTGLVSIVEEVVNTNYISLNPIVTLTSSGIFITEDAANTDYTSLNPSTLLTPEPIGIVSTVCFDGSIAELIYNGNQVEIYYDGKSINIEFNGSFNEISFDGTIQTTCNQGSIKINC